MLLIAFLGCSNERKSTEPNVLFIVVDDLRDWTGYSTAFSGVKTPNLNKLAQMGMVFTNAYCAAPVCSPSRTALLSGISPAKTGMYDNGQSWEGALRKAETLTRKFMNSGYYVAGFGKIYHGEGDIKNWDEFIYGEYSPLPDSCENYYALGNPLNIADSLTGDWKRATNAIKVLDRGVDKPLFLACGIVKPHTPWNVPQKYFDMYAMKDIRIPEVYQNDLDDIPEIGKKIAGKMHYDQYGKSIYWTHKAIVDSGLWQTNIRAYMASITYADAQIGRLIDAWQESEYSENGIIVIMGDNGWHHGEKEHWSKRTLWEESTRVPLIIVVPGLTKPGIYCTSPVSLLDIYPTLVDLCGLEPKQGLDGLSLKPLLVDPTIPWNRPVVTIWGQDNVSVRTKEWRYIQYCDNTKELYNQNTDPNEWHNLLFETESKYDTIIQKMQKWIPKCTVSNSYDK